MSFGVQEPQYKPFCCSQQAKWVIHSPSLYYFYCEVCKKEVISPEDKAASRSHGQIASVPTAPALPGRPWGNHFGGFGDTTDLQMDSYGRPIEATSLSRTLVCPLVAQSIRK